MIGTGVHLDVQELKMALRTIEAAVDEMTNISPTEIRDVAIIDLSEQPAFYYPRVKKDGEVMKNVFLIRHPCTVGKLLRLWKFARRIRKEQKC